MSQDSLCFGALPQSILLSLFGGQSLDFTVEAGILDLGDESQTS